MPHSIEAPEDLESFDELLSEYCKGGAEDAMALIDRIVAWNSVHLPGATGTDDDDTHPIRWTTSLSLALHTPRIQCRI